MPRAPAAPPCLKRRIGLLGGSFNPAHRGHAHISRQALRLLDLDELWWLVSPGNPLKPVDGMAPFPARLASARAAARRVARTRVSGIEKRLGTRFTADTIARLAQLYPHIRFIWLMGADNLVHLHQWERWRDLARTVPIAVFARPRYLGDALTAPAMGWLRRFKRAPAAARNWSDWRPPAIVILPIRLDPTSATAIRAGNPRWAEDIGAGQPE